MLRVTYEIIPFGDEDHKNRRTIAVQNIGNYSDCAEDSEYVSKLKDDGIDSPPNAKIRLRHNRSEGAFELVRKTLEKHCGH